MTNTIKAKTAAQTAHTCLFRVNFSPCCLIFKFSFYKIAAEISTKKSRQTLQHQLYYTNTRTKLFHGPILHISSKFQENQFINNFLGRSPQTVEKLYVKNYKKKIRHQGKRCNPKSIWKFFFKFRTANLLPVPLNVKTPNSNIFKLYK